MAKGMVWRIPLDEEDDVAVLRLVVERGKVVEFALSYSAFIGGCEVDVVRYDTCHGHLHVHRMWLDPPNDRVALESPWGAKGGTTTDYTEAVEYAKNDLLANWRSYRSQMEMKS